MLANRSYGTDTGAKMETPLHGAARTGNVLLVQLLLEHHADARARDGTGATPAHVAIRAKADGARDVLAVLLDAAGDDAESDATRTMTRSGPPAPSFRRRRRGSAARCPHTVTEFAGGGGRCAGAVVRLCSRCLGTRVL